jgi:hypothetical protein
VRAKPLLRRRPARLLPERGEGDLAGDEYEVIEVSGDGVGDLVLNLVRHPALPANFSAMMPLTPSGPRTRNLMGLPSGWKTSSKTKNPG